jgi:hypothetical protein
MFVVNAALAVRAGPYVGLAVSRWWAVRKDGVGALWGAVDDLAVWSACFFNSGTLADHSARALVLRYGLLSHALLYKQARRRVASVPGSHASQCLAKRVACVAVPPGSHQPWATW